MSTDGLFFSALQPKSTVTTYGLPSDVRLGNGGSSMSDEVSKARRVQEQVQMRLAQKSTLPRQNGGATSQYAMSDVGGSSTMKYQTYNPNYSTTSSHMYSGSRTLGPRMTQRSAFSAHSAGPAGAQYQRISVGGGGHSTMFSGGAQIGGFQRSMRPRSAIEHESLSMHAMGQHPGQVNAWMDGSDAGSMMSERDATYGRQYAQSAVNGYSSQVRQGGTMTFQSPMRRSLSGTLATGGGGGMGMSRGDVELVHQQSFKGPAQRTISRMAQRNKMSMGSMQRQVSSATSFGSGGEMVDGGGFIGPGQMMVPGGLSRAMSIKSMHSVGRGMDIYNGQMEMGASMGNLSGINSLDMITAVEHLRDSDPNLQVLGAAYIQHECYNDSDAKIEVRRLKGISELVKLFNSESQEVQRFATGATRNLIYENMDNKVALIEEGGIPQLVEALKENDDELRKNITGILWNLSSKDNLKQKLARETLPELTEKILIPVSSSENISLSASEAEIFYNTTGCLRNLSSVNDKTRQQMRDTPGLVDSLVSYIKTCLEDSKTEDKGVENAVCIMRNLSYQLYSEIPPSMAHRLEGPTRDQDTGKGGGIGCFTANSKKHKSGKSQDLATFSEVARVPRGMEWLWHPQVVSLYNRVLHQCDINATSREAAAGALQNITAGEKRWASVLSQVALEQERMLPVLQDLLQRTNNDLELRSLTGFLRNLSRHARDKNDFSTKVVNHLVTKLPCDGHQKTPSSEVVVNICGILNNLVTTSSVAARDISFFDGLPKLVGIKTSHDNSAGKTKAGKAAATVLSNMFQYKKLHSSYKEKGFMRRDFVDTI